MVLEPKSNTNTPVINPSPSIRMISFEQSSNNDTLMASPPPRNMPVGPKSNNDKPTTNPPPPTRSKVLISKSNNDTPLINPPPPTQNKAFKPNSNKATTPHVNPSPMSSLSPPMPTTSQFYFNTQISPLNLNFAEQKNFGWTNNYPSFHHNYLGMNPMPQCGSSSNRPEYVTMPLLHLGSYQSLPETDQTHNHSIFQFGSGKKQTENTSSSLLQSGSGSNLDLSKTNSILQPGSSSIPVDKNVSLELSLGLGKSHSSSSNRPFDSNRAQKIDFIDFQFKSLALNPVRPVTNADKILNQLVGGLALNPVKPVIESEKTANQLDQIRKGKSIFTFQSPAKAKGSGENNDAGKRDGGEIYGGDSAERDDGEVDLGGVPVVGEVDVGGGGERDDDEVDGGQGGEPDGGKINGGGEREDGEVDGDDDKDEEQEKEVEVETERSDEESNNESKKLWNLRPRKPTKKEEKKSGGGGSSRKPTTRSQRKAEMPQRMELKLTLTNEEIEHDFLLMTGQKPPKKPIKRSTKVQKSVEVIIFSPLMMNS